MPVNEQPEGKTILLINPQHHRDWRYGESMFSFPLGLLYIATALKKAGFLPVIIDACVQPDYMKFIYHHLKSTVMVGISAMTPQVAHGRSIAMHIRNNFPEVPIIWGGIHPSLYPGTCLDESCDAAVLGEGDVTAVELARCYQGKKDPSEVLGVALSKSGDVFLTGDRPLMQMDDLPFLDYSFLDTEKYIETYVIQEGRRARILPIHAARGCPWHCTFCINTTLNSERRYRFRSSEHLLDEMENLAERFRLDGFMIQDEEFFANRSRVIDFLDGIEKREMNRFRYFATCRVNHFRPGYIDREFLERLKRCGFVDLVFGFESGSMHCLEIIQKEITVDQGFYAAKLLAESGFKAVWGFIMAIPGETRQDIIQTLHAMNRLRKMSRENYFIGPQVFRPYPGSVLYQEAIKFGLSEPGTLQEWGRQNFSPEGWLGASELPWISEQDRNFIEFINFIAPIYFNRNYLTPNWQKKFVHWILRRGFDLRLSLDFWSFPVEHLIRNSLLKMTKKFNNAIAAVFNR